MTYVMLNFAYYQLHDAWWQWFMFLNIGMLPHVMLFFLFSNLHDAWLCLILLLINCMMTLMRILNMDACYILFFCFRNCMMHGYTYPLMNAWKVVFFFFMVQHKVFETFESRSRSQNAWNAWMFNKKAWLPVLLILLHEVHAWELWI